jgi:UDP-N-acetylmuramoyl-tripeptide--D-alanyl-D-alanine ligase
MFQLNSYKPAEHGRWIAKEIPSVMARQAPCVIAFLVLVIFPETLAAIIVSAILFLMSIILNRPKPAKKKLVYTHRVLRMLGTTALLFIIITVLALFFFLPLLPLFCVLAPLLPIAANFINRPIEKHISQGYVNDARKIIRSMQNLVVIGITGSYGKTSTKYYLSKLLGAKYSVCMTPQNYNTTLGVVKTIRENLRATHEIFVCEMGARNVGDIKEISDLVTPSIGILVSIGNQHLESFKTIENIEKTKFELIDSLPATGMAFLNLDNDIIRNHKTQKPFTSFGVTSKGLDCYATDAKSSSKGTSFVFHSKSGDSFPVTTKLLGAHNVLNLVGAMAVADYLGVGKAELASQAKKIEGVPHRLELVPGHGCTIIDDAYNSNPQGAKSALETLAGFDGFKILVTPGMVELGNAQDECNRVFGEQAADACDFAILVGEAQTRSILKGLESKNFSPDKIYVAQSLNDALDKAYSLDAKGKEKVILLENDLPDNY